MVAVGGWGVGGGGGGKQATDAMRALFPRRHKRLG